MYFIIFFVGILLSMINDRKKISFKFFALLLFVLAFLRYGVGADYFSYNFLYSRLDKSLIGEIKYGLDNQEVFFRLLGSWLKNIGFSYELYLGFIAGINILFISKTCSRYSENPTLSLLVYYCFYYFVWTFSGLRQGIALAVGVYYLLRCLEDKKTIKLVLISFFLSLIHTSALILIPLYFLAGNSFDKNKLIIASFIAIILAMLPLATVISKLNWIPFIDRLIPYINSGNPLINMFNFKTLVRVVFLFIGLFYYNAYSSQGVMWNNIIKIYILSLIFYFVFKFSEPTAARISIYGVLLNILILPNIYYLYKEKFDRYLFRSGLILFCVLYLNRNLESMERESRLKTSQEIITPYTNIYNKDKYTFDKKYIFYLND